jgi:cell wall-associated NlpC family hydrolase
MGAIGEAESRGRNVVQQGQPYSRTGWGIWQITPGDSEPSIGVDRQLLDPHVNARAAVAKEESQGLGAWTTYTSGAYKRFMPGGRASSSGGAGDGGGYPAKSGDAFVANAARYVGTPYVWGGSSPKGFDCSGLVEYVLSNMGIRNVPRTSEAQYAWTKRVSAKEVVPGDLVFLNFPGEVSPGHVMIYAGGRQVIQAARPGTNVEETSFNPQKPGSNEWGATVVGYGRVPGLSYAGETPFGGPVVLPGQGNVPGQGNANSRPGTGGGDSWVGDVWGGLEGAVESGAGDAGSLLGDAASLISAPLDFLKAALWLVNPLNWLRAVEVVIGAVLILLGVLVAVKADELVKEVAGDAAASKIPAA